MKFLFDIPPSFWGLFRSVNREIYMEALLAINEEYQYSDYFLSREACLQVLNEMCARRRFTFEREESESEEDEKESLHRRILNWLLRAGWLRRVEDYNTMTANIVIPDYAAVFIEAFERLVNAPADDTQIYIQNVYATLFSFKNDSRKNLSMLKTALVNTRKLNKALQDMLHNMDMFFSRLLEQHSYGELLREHLEGYVEEVVRKKYHILKTSDNFYIYKTDIKRCLKEMREDTEWLERVRAQNPQNRGTAGNTLESAGAFAAASEPSAGHRGEEENTARSVAASEPSAGHRGEEENTARSVAASEPFAGHRGEEENTARSVADQDPVVHAGPVRDEEGGYFRRRQEDVLDLIDQIERGFDDIERRISNMDREHSKYVRATVSRLNYLLSESSDRKGLVLKLLNRLAEPGEEAERRRRLQLTASCIRLSSPEFLQEEPLYKRRRRRSSMEEDFFEEKDEELGREEVLQLNRLQRRYSARQIEHFIEEHMDGGIFCAGSLRLNCDEDFEKLILAYDLCMRKNSGYEVAVSGETVDNGAYRYPSMMFVRKEK